MFLPGAELMLHCEVYGAEGSERAMLVAALDKLGPGDVLVLDRGYPAAWLVSLLLQRGIHFCIRCDGSGWSAVRRFMRSGLTDEWVTLSAPSAAEDKDGTQNPLRWSAQTRNWGFIDAVHLNPDTPQSKEPEAAKKAA